MQTILLTIGEDNLTGTSGNDIFNAPIVQDNAAGAAETLEDFDVLDGGAGVDTLNITLDGGTPAPTLKNIEIINVRDTDTGGSTLDLVNATGVEQVWSRNSNNAGSLTIDNVGSTDIQFGIANTKGGLEIVFADDAVAGGKDTLKLALNNAGNAVITADDTSTTGDVIEAVTLQVSGNNVADITGVGKAVETLTITGDGSVELAVDATALSKLDAAAMTQGLAIDISDAAAATLNVATGAGDDAVLIDGSLLVAANDKIKIDLGAGNNTLGLANIKTDVALGTLVFDKATIANVNTLVLEDDITLGADATLNLKGLDASGLVFGDALGGDTFALTIDNSAAALDVTFEGAVGETPKTFAIDFKTATSVVMNAEDDVLGTTLTGNKLTSLTVNVTEDGATFGDAAIAGDEVTIKGQDDKTKDTLKTVTLSDTSDAGDAAIGVILVDTTNVNKIVLSGGEATDFTLDVSGVTFAGAVTVEIGNFGVDADGTTAGGLSYTSDDTNGVREIFKFVGDNIGDITIETGSFLAGVGATADRLDFSQIAGINSLDDLNIELVAGDTVITAADSQFDGTITITGVDLTTDAVNFIL